MAKIISKSNITLDEALGYSQEEIRNFDSATNLNVRAVLMEERDALKEEKKKILADNNVSEINSKIDAANKQIGLLSDAMIYDDVVELSGEDAECTIFGVLAPEVVEETSGVESSPSVKKVVKIEKTKDYSVAPGYTAKDIFKYLEGSINDTGTLIKIDFVCPKKPTIEEQTTLDILVEQGLLVCNDSVSVSEGKATARQISLFEGADLI